MGIPVLSDSAICMCSHGGQLKFIVTHFKADGADSQVLTISDYSNAMIVGCVLPPIAGGPCLKVLTAIDPLGQAMKVNGNAVVTQAVISMTANGWPILVVYPGRSAISINPVPAIPPIAPSSRLPHEAVTIKIGVRGRLHTSAEPPPETKVPYSEGHSSLASDSPSGSLADKPALAVTRDIISSLSPTEVEAIERASTFKPQGVSAEEAEAFLINTADGREMLRLLKDGDTGASTDTIIGRAVEQVMSGTEPPKLKALEQGAKLYKLVPNKEGRGPSDYTPFFCSQEQLELAQKSGRPLSDVFGLPAVQNCDEYNIFEMEATEDTTVLESAIAPTEELDGKFRTGGGAVQTIVPNRRKFTAPAQVRTVKDNIN